MNDESFWTQLLHMPGPYRDAAYVLLLIVLVVWFHTLKWRIADPVLVKYYRAITYSLIIFCSLRIFKLALEDSSIVAGRYLWYLFYVALFTFVTITILMVHYILEPSWTKIANIFLIATNATFALVVVTNDFHHFIFDFPESGRRAGEHIYNIGFAVLSLWLALWALYMMIFMLSICVWVRKWWHTFNLSIVVVLFSSYAVSYIQGNAPHTEYVMTYTVFFVLMLETLMRSGAIPYNRSYTHLFNHTTVPVYLYDSHWHLQRATQPANGVPNSVLSAFQSGSTYLSLSHPNNPNPMKEYVCSPIIGGWAIWENDMSSIVKHQEELERICSQLDRILKLVKRELTTNTEKVRLNYQHDITSRVEKAISSQLKRIEPLRDELPHATDEKRAENLRRIGIILGHCKRIGLVVLASYASPESTIDKAHIYRHLENACIDFASPKATAGCFMSSTGTMTVESALDLISTAHAVLEIAIQHRFTSVFMRYTPGRFAILLDDTREAQTLIEVLTQGGYIKHSSLSREESYVLVVIDDE